MNTPASVALRIAALMPSQSAAGAQYGDGDS
jgi:hypothetical protein